MIKLHKHAGAPMEKNSVRFIYRVGKANEVYDITLNGERNTMLPETVGFIRYEIRGLMKEGEKSKA